jgi:di/tricarboxylate transporter
MTGGRARRGQDADPMTLHQTEAFLIVGAMLALFAWDRLRYDLVAAAALSLAALTGVVPAAKAFEGFANPVVIIIASVLVLGRAVATSGLIETVMRRMLARVQSQSLQIGILTAAVTFLSAVMKNVGTLGIFMPIAIQVAQRSGRSPSSYLMPLAFGSLVGGTITQIGTSPNLLISSVRQDLTGQAFSLFDFTPVGLPLALIAIVFLALAWRIIPRRRSAAAGSERAFNIEDYVSQARIPPDSSLVGKTVAELEELGEGELSVNAIISPTGRRHIPRGSSRLAEGDVLMLRADPVAAKPIFDQTGLEVVGADKLPPATNKDEEIETVEAVVTSESPLVGRTPQHLRLRRDYGVSLLAVGRAGQRITTPLPRTRLQIGDVLILQGRHGELTETLTRLACLPLAERHITLGEARPRFIPVVVLVAALALASLQIVPVQIAFFVGAVAVVLLRSISVKAAYDAIDWPIIVMLGCVIPVGESLKETGATELMAGVLTSVAAQLPGTLALGLILVASMLITPMLHHAAAVLVMGPVAAVVAGNLGYTPDAFLMAVALGASCDFLTPIGHQNNLLVMGPGGYRFNDYWRLGLPLSCVVAVLGTLLIAQFWPLR